MPSQSFTRAGGVRAMFPCSGMVQAETLAARLADLPCAPGMFVISCHHCAAARQHGELEKVEVPLRFRREGRLR
eukprot:688690-Amphidinium_carterae.1